MERQIQLTIEQGMAVIATLASAGQSGVDGAEWTMPTDGGVVTENERHAFGRVVRMRLIAQGARCRVHDFCAVARVVAAVTSNSSTASVEGCKR